MSMPYTRDMRNSVEATKGLRRQAEILAVARQLLVEEGYDRFVLREIAARVSMTLGNLQYYFRTRESLIGALAHAESEADRKVLEEISDGKRSGDVRLTELTRSLLKRWSGDGGKVYAVALFLSLSQTPFRDVQRRIYERFYEQLLPILTELTPGSRRSVLLDKARLITALLDGALIQLHNGAPSATTKSQEHFIDRIASQVVTIAR